MFSPWLNRNTPTPIISTICTARIETSSRSSCPCGKRGAATAISLARSPVNEATTTQITAAATAKQAHNSSTDRQLPSKNGSSTEWVRVSETTPPIAGPVM